jgi:hypothetical protein
VEGGGGGGKKKGRKEARKQGSKGGREREREGRRRRSSSFGQLANDIETVRARRSAIGKWTRRGHAMVILISTE